MTGLKSAEKLKYFKIGIPQSKRVLCKCSVEGLTLFPSPKEREVKLSDIYQLLC
jgi:hypothetical protein